MKSMPAHEGSGASGIDGLPAEKGSRAAKREQHKRKAAMGSTIIFFPRQTAYSEIYARSCRDAVYCLTMTLSNSCIGPTLKRRSAGQAGELLPEVVVVSFSNLEKIWIVRFSWCGFPCQVVPEEYNLEFNMLKTIRNIVAVGSYCFFLTKN